MTISLWIQRLRLNAFIFSAFSFYSPSFLQHPSLLCMSSISFTSRRCRSAVAGTLCCSPKFSPNMLFAPARPSRLTSGASGPCHSFSEHSRQRLVVSLLIIILPTQPYTLFHSLKWCRTSFCKSSVFWTLFLRLLLSFVHFNLIALFIIKKLKKKFLDLSNNNFV